MAVTITDPAETLGRARVPRIAAAAAVVMLAVAVVSGLVWYTGREDNTASASSTTAATTEHPAAGLERKVESTPTNAGAWAALGASYVDRASANSDPADYPRAERALLRSLELAPDGNWEALGGMAALAAGRHDFAGALNYAERARDLNPRNLFVRAVLVDALTELGRYPEAVEAAQAMIDLRPNLSSFARVSYQRELHGDVPGAFSAMEEALTTASTRDDRAFATYYLGEIEWQRGNVDAAARHFEAVLRIDPASAPATAGLGRVAAARGDLAGAIARYEEAVAAFPDPETLKELAELHILRGNKAEAAKRIGEFERSNAAQAANGVDVNLEIALFSADHRQDLDRGLHAASEEWRLRQSVHVADALAWQLFVNGRPDEALEYANRALDLGTRSAQFHFHRAEIERALGQVEAARADYEAALAINRNFSILHRATAERALAELASQA